MATVVFPRTPPRRGEPNVAPSQRTRRTPSISGLINEGLNRELMSSWFFFFTMKQHPILGHFTRKRHFKRETWGCGNNDYKGLLILTKLDSTSRVFYVKWRGKRQKDYNMIVQVYVKDTHTKHTYRYMRYVYIYYNIVWYNII